MKAFLDRLKGLLVNTDNEKIARGENIFEVLYHGREEVTLHSRFISYLLSSNEDYLKIFVEDILELKGKFSIDGCQVIPNKEDKTEYQNIDILIINEAKRQAIIIENKIDAEPSIHHDADEKYQGQLDRYFHNITTGLDKNGKACRFVCDKENTHVFCLTLYKPVEGARFCTPQRLTYYSIQRWLIKCLAMNSENSGSAFFRQIIQQYLNLVIRMTTDNEKVLEITDMIEGDNDYWKSAYTFATYYKDVKWHTIHRFYKELIDRMGDEFLSLRMPDDDVITKVAHKNSNIPLVVQFEYMDKTLFIINDNKGFTLRDKTKWDYFPNEICGVIFHTFSDEATFKLINKSNRQQFIDSMIGFIRANHDNLKNRVE